MRRRFPVKNSAPEKQHKPHLAKHIAEPESAAGSAVDLSWLPPDDADFVVWGQAVARASGG